MRGVDRTKQYFQRASNLRGAGRLFSELGAHYDAAHMEENHQNMACAHSADPITDIHMLLDYGKPQKSVAKKSDLIGAIAESSPYRYSMRDG